MVIRERHRKVSRSMMNQPDIAKDSGLTLPVTDLRDKWSGLWFKMFLRAGQIP